MTLERTVDGKDYKLVVKRGRTRLKNGTQEPRSYEGQVEPYPQEQPASEGHTEPNSDVSADAGKGIELLTYFHRVFFGTEAMTAQPAQKHRDLADWMIASHGETLARYIVDFAKTEAEKTRFAVATFGAVANYIDRAVTHYTLEQARLKREEEARREEARQTAEVNEYQAREQRGYQLFRALPEAVRNELLGYARMELIKFETWKNADFTNPLYRTMFDKEAEELVRRHLVNEDARQIAE